MECNLNVRPEAIKFLEKKKKNKWYAPWHNNTVDKCWIPESGRLGGNGNPHQYSCLEKLMDRGVWQATVYTVTKRQTGLITHTQTMLIAANTNKVNAM